MREVLIVAQREYRQLTSTRSFWITLLAIPLIIGFLALIPSLYGHKAGASAFFVLDRTGRYAEEIDRRVELDYQRSLLAGLVDYAKHWHVHAPPSGAVWADRRGRLIDDFDTEAFMKAGGIDAALAEIRPLLPPDATPFETPPRRFIRVGLPAGIAADASDEAFGAAVEKLLSTELDTPDGRRPFGLAAYIPEHPEDRSQPVRYWTSGRYDGGLSGLISGVVLHDLRARMMQEHGIDAAAGLAIELFYPATRVTAPEPGEGANRIALRSALPLGLAYLLLITIIVSGTMMLQGTIEERSNKLLETLLACIDANQLLQGKLIGVGAVGLTIAGTWLVFAIAGAYAIPADIMETLRPALQILHSPATIIYLAFYFVTGYLVTAILFLTIGAMSDSMQDAQGYLVPLVFCLTGPFLVLVGTVVDNPGGLLPVILSWIPIYTPFAMLARLGGGVSWVELAGTSALLLLFVFGEFALLGRVFRASLLRAGQPPKLRDLVRLMRR
ncbi:MAG TPA: ABC transporter permease [Stellaceae bacterium]|nr:ABC transporter permease [Stellaceae bacterium]